MVSKGGGTRDLTAAPTRPSQGVGELKGTGSLWAGPGPAGCPDSTYRRTLGCTLLVDGTCRFIYNPTAYGSREAETEMANGEMPANLAPGGSTAVFTQSTVPEALQREHRLAEGVWGVLHVLTGNIRFVDLESSQEETIAAPGNITIRPDIPHRVAVEGPVEFRIEFFREPDSD